MVDPNRIRIETHLREEVDTEQLALALLDLLPLLDRATRDQLEIVGGEIRRRMDEAAKDKTEPAA
jgi:hypothetical protein